MPLWTPADLAVAPHAWYDVADVGTLALSGSNVVSVADKGGAGRTLFGSAVNPVYSSSGFPGGLPAILTNTQAALRTPVTNGSDFGLRGPNFAVFMEYAHNNPNNGWYTRLLSLHPRPITNGGDYGNPDGANVFWFPDTFAYDWNNNASPGQAIPTNTATSLSIVGGTSSQEVYWDGGSAYDLAVPGPLIVGSVGIMQGPTYDAYENTPAGMFGEFLALGYTPTAADRQLIEGYLAWKWGSVGRLPANHPYKTAAPQTEAEGITGNASATLAAINGASAGRLAITGTATRTLAGVARSSTARIRIRANATRTLAGVAGAATGASLITGNASQQLQALTGSATGESQALTPITGNAAALLSDLTGSATATTGPVIPDEQPSAGGWGARPLNSRTRRAIRRGIERELERQKSEQDELASAYDRAQGIVEAALEAADIPVPATVAAPDLYEATRQVVAMAEAAELEMQMVARHLLVRIDAYLLELKSQRDAEEMAIALLLVA